MVALIGAIITLSYLLGTRHRDPARNEPYESGIRPTGSGRLRWGAKYYLIAIFFILFDVEAAFVLVWAAAFWELGWFGYAAISLFVVTLAVGLVYVWRLGGLDWYSQRDRRQEGERE